MRKMSREPRPVDIIGAVTPLDENAAVTRGCLLRMAELRDRLRVGQRYRLREDGVVRKVRLVAKHRCFAVLEFPGIVVNYRECRGWYDLLGTLEGRA